MVSVGYGAQPITLLTVRYGSYSEEQKTRVAFDFSADLPHLTTILIWKRVKYNSFLKILGLLKKRLKPF